VSAQLDALLADGREDVLAAVSTAYESARFEDPGEIAAATEWLRAHPAAEGILLLLALRRDAPAAYRSLPADTRARILVAAMRERASLNDFGYLDEAGGRDREAGEALLELGEAAVGPLVAELADMQPGQLEGSEEATLAHDYRLRRADFAYRYLARILGMQPRFDPDPAVRDAHIGALRRSLTASGACASGCRSGTRA
jgi:hypothetical protein